MRSQKGVVPRLNNEIQEHLRSYGNLCNHESAIHRVRRIMSGIARRLNLEGEVKLFGSFLNGFKTGTSDLDLVFTQAASQQSVVSLLAKFTDVLPEYGFGNVTKIFSAGVPLVKFTDTSSGLEVDFCINNELGVRNSLLLYTYTQCDPRVLQLGMLVKDWAKIHEVARTADGCLNSYAYMLLTIYFLQSVTPPVVPNLQKLATTSHPVNDSKWGCEDCWETKFLDQLSCLPPSKNNMNIGELLTGFFRFYTCQFDWNTHAVCIRLGHQEALIPKNTLPGSCNREQWMIEDPFDLKHNLAGRCTRAGRQRILDKMHASLGILTYTGSWALACPPQKVDAFFLKCRVGPEVSPQALLEEFEELGLVKLHFHKPSFSGARGQAFLEFNSAADRRCAHTKNESYVAGCQLHLHYTSNPFFHEAAKLDPFSTYEIASYRMQKRVSLSRKHVLHAMQLSNGPASASPLTGSAPLYGTPYSQTPLSCMPSGSAAAYPSEALYSQKPPCMLTGNAAANLNGTVYSQKPSSCIPLGSAAAYPNGTEHSQTPPCMSSGFVAFPNGTLHNQKLTSCMPAEPAVAYPNGTAYSQKQPPCMPLVSAAAYPNRTLYSQNQPSSIQPPPRHVVPPAISLQTLCRCHRSRFRRLHEVLQRLPLQLLQLRLLLLLHT